MITELFNKEIFECIKANESSDAYELSLRSRNFPPEIRKLIAEQVRARQKAREKVPSWMDYDQVILPKPLSVEQSSSELAAGYISRLVQGGRLLDITGGMGVDTFFFSHKAEKVDYVEQDAVLTEIARHNFSLFGVKNVSFHNQAAASFLEGSQSSQPYDYIYMDPSRRKSSKKVFLFEDSEPDLLKMQDALLQRTKILMVKASPFVDLKYALGRLKKVHEVHFVAIGNECKEILFVSGSQGGSSDPGLITVNIAGDQEQTYASTLRRERESDCDLAEMGRYIYDPNAAIRKAGLFRSICKDFDLGKPSANSHIYFSNTLHRQFPGRVFDYTGAFTYREFIKKPPFRQANIAIRNFPNSVDQIRKKSGIREGGDTYVFGTTGQDKRPYFVTGSKIM